MLMHSVTDPADPHERLLDACCAAIELGEIDVLFQPQFRIQDGAIVGAEALARRRLSDLVRADPAQKNKGGEAAQAALALWALQQRFHD